MNSGDTIIFPVNIGKTTRMLAEENCLKLLELLDYAFPKPYKVILTPYRDDDNYYYPLIIRGLNNIKDNNIKDNNNES